MASYRITPLNEGMIKGLKLTWLCIEGLLVYWVFGTAGIMFSLFWAFIVGRAIRILFTSWALQFNWMRHVDAGELNFSAIGLFFFYNLEVIELLVLLLLVKLTLWTGLLLSFSIFVQKNVVMVIALLMGYFVKDYVQSFRDWLMYSDLDLLFARKQELEAKMVDSNQLTVGEVQLRIEYLLTTLSLRSLDNGLGLMIRWSINQMLYDVSEGRKGMTDVFYQCSEVIATNLLKLKGLTETLTQSERHYANLFLGDIKYLLNGIKKIEKFNQDHPDFFQHMTDCLSNINQLRTEEGVAIVQEKAKEWFDSIENIEAKKEFETIVMGMVILLVRFSQNSGHPTINSWGVMTKDAILTSIQDGAVESDVFVSKVLFNKIKDRVLVEDDGSEWIVLRA